MESSPRLPFPRARFYAVVRMDPLAMVKDLGLDDSETLRAVEALRPKKYLVYVNIVLDLPMPTSKWCRYCIKLVANTLCPDDRRHKILPDMVVPIFPNTQCSSDTRPPIRPLREFPFHNCFHWLPLESNSYIRMRRHSPDVDSSRAIRLNSDQNHATSSTFRQDYDRMRALPSQRYSDESSSATTFSRNESINTVPDWALLDPVVREACSPIDFSQKQMPAAVDEPQEGEPDLDSPSPSTSSRSIEDNASKDKQCLQCGVDEKFDLTSSTAEVFMLNIFGWDPDPTFPLIPLVDLWFDLEEHLTPETIPSPKEWFEEERKVNAIIRDAFARRKLTIGDTLLTTVSSTVEDSSTSTGGDSTSSLPIDDSSNSVPEEPEVSVLMTRGNSDPEAPHATPDKAPSIPQSRFKLAEILHTLGTRIRRVFRHTPGALCSLSRNDNARCH